MFKREGGVPESYPTMDASPFDPALMSRWLGVPIGEPCVAPADEFRAYVFGKPFDLDPVATGLHIVERGRAPPPSIIISIIKRWRWE